MQGAVLDQNYQRISIADWYATFAFLAAVDPTDNSAALMGLPPIDSLNVWPLLAGWETVSPRDEILLTTGGIAGSGGGLIAGDFKILFGTQKPAIFPTPVYPNGTDPAPLTLDCGNWANEGSGCLFHLGNDPTEHEDLGLNTSYDTFRESLRQRYSALREGMYQTPAGNLDSIGMNCTDITALFDANYNGFWGPYATDFPYNTTPPVAAAVEA